MVSSTNRNGTTKRQRFLKSRFLRRDGESSDRTRKRERPAYAAPTSARPVPAGTIRRPSPTRIGRRMPGIFRNRAGAERCAVRRPRDAATDFVHSPSHGCRHGKPRKNRFREAAYSRTVRTHVLFRFSRVFTLPFFFAVRHGKAMCHNCPLPRYSRDSGLVICNKQTPVTLNALHWDNSYPPEKACAEIRISIHALSQSP